MKKMILSVAMLLFCLVSFSQTTTSANTVSLAGPVLFTTGGMPDNGSVVTAVQEQADAGMTSPDNNVGTYTKAFKSVTFTIYNTSTQSVSWSFHLTSGQVAAGVIGPHITYPFTIADNTYQVALNNANSPPLSFHMEFNTGYGGIIYAPGHVFNGVVVDAADNTSLDLY